MPAPVGAVRDLPRGESGGRSGASGERAGHFVPRLPGVTPALSWPSVSLRLRPFSCGEAGFDRKAGAHSLQNTRVRHSLLPVPEAGLRPVLHTQRRGFPSGGRRLL